MNLSGGTDIDSRKNSSSTSFLQRLDYNLIVYSMGLIITGSEHSPNSGNSKSEIQQLRSRMSKILLPVIDVTLLTLG